MEIKEVVALCDELMESKLLFADQKINKLLEAIVSCPDVYELLSDCMNNFNKEKEFESAFVKDASGKGIYVQPKEEYKVLALAFCLLADIGNHKISFNNLIMTYFNSDGRFDGKLFMNKVIKPFKDLIIEAFGITQSDEKEDFVVTDQMEIDEDELTTEQKLKIIPFRIDRASNHIRDPKVIGETFLMAKETAVEIVEKLETERLDQQKKDCINICHCLIIACMEQDFDLVCGLACGLKYAARGLKSVKYNLRELEDILQRQLNYESRT